MDVARRSDGRFIIIHSGREVDADFDTQEGAWRWADANIDDQMFDSPNWLADPLRYRSAEPSHSRLRKKPITLQDALKVSLSGLAKSRG